MKFAVIPSNGRACLIDAINAIGPQVDHVIVIDTGTAWGTLDVPRSEVTRYPCNTPMNISHWWNEGLDIAQSMAFHHKTIEWDVAVINDDAVVPPGWVDAISNFMRETGSVAGCSGGYTNVLTSAEAVPLEYRMQGFAFVLRGEEGLRGNEKIQWYFSDDYLDWEARKAGGMAMVQGYPVDHRYPNGQMIPEFQAQVARDARTFMELYGKMPW